METNYFDCSSTVYKKETIPVLITHPYPLRPYTAVIETMYNNKEVISVLVTRLYPFGPDPSS